MTTTLPPSSEPAVSVVIPVRNGALHLGEALASVVRQTGVTDIVVVDDGSTDATPDVAQSSGDPRVRYVRQDPAGAGAARNRGVALATGRMLAFLDADDVWLPGKLARQLAVLADDGADIVFTRIEEFVSPELSAEEAAVLRPHPGVMNGVSCTTLVMGRADFLRVGLFDESLRTGEFLHWHARACDMGLRSVTLPERLAMRRLHRTNQGRAKDGHRQQYAAILRDVLQRRRAGA